MSNIIDFDYSVTKEIRKVLVIKYGASNTS